MRRDVNTQLDQLKAKMNGYVALLMYRYANLCIEANPIALLPISVKVEGEQKHLEEVAKVAVHEKYHFNIYPIFEDDFFAIGRAIGEAHPEFIQETKTMEGFDDDDPAGKYLYCTMPIVNKDYHDTLLKAVDALYEECKDKMEVANKACLAKMAILMDGASEKDYKQLTDYCDEIEKQFADLRDKAHDDKKQEIEGAYADFQAKQQELQAQMAEKMQEAGNPLQMKMQ